MAGILGPPHNDAIRPLIEQAIGLVGTLTPLAAEAGKRIKDAIQFVIAAFQSGQLLSLVESALQLGFAEGINTLVSGFRYAISFFWNLLTDGSMWGSLGMTLLGVAAGFGAALLDAFNTPIVYLQAGMEWVVASLMNGLLKIPGMSDLLGLDSVDSNWSSILAARKADGADLFGIKPKEMAAAAAEIIAGSAPALGASIAAAAQKAGEQGGSSLVDTGGLKARFDEVVGSITASLPKPDEVKQAASAAAGVGTAATATAQASRLDPIVTSLGKVGGGGYASGVLDAQRENNRLTGQTNTLLTAIRDKLTGKGGAAGIAVFG